jgi:hypothetical protein
LGLKRKQEDQIAGCIGVGRGDVEIEDRGGVGGDGAEVGDPGCGCRGGG